MSVVKTTFDLSPETVTLLELAQGQSSKVQSLENLLWTHPVLMELALNHKLSQPTRLASSLKVQNGPKLKQLRLY